MHDDLIATVLQGMCQSIDDVQLKQLELVLRGALAGYSLTPMVAANREDQSQTLIASFLRAKEVEGCSKKTTCYYRQTITSLHTAIGKDIRTVQTEDIRSYLAQYQEARGASKVTMDNIRRILSSFFSWLEDEDLIIKNPVRRIHKVKTASRIKDVYTDEELERMRDSCSELRDLAIIDLLASTGMRIGELVGLNREDINFAERECIVFGKGEKERIVYFDARTKLHLSQYIAKRTDTENALFVTLTKPIKRIQIGGIEARLRKIGKNIGINRVHPHKFRRTLATQAIDKGMPVEQVQCLLGHRRIHTTMQYAMVRQGNVKASHRRYIG